MPRNLDTRVELLAPVEDQALRAEIEDTLERCLADDTFAWELDTDGSWTRRRGRTRSVHRELMERAASTRPGPQHRAVERQHAGGRLAHAGAEAGRAARQREQPREHLVPARGAGHQDQVGTGAHRALGGGGDARAGQHGRGLEAVRDHHAVEAEPRGAAGRWPPRATATRSGARRAPGRARARASPAGRARRTAAANGTSSRLLQHVARRVDRDRPVVGVQRGRAQAGEVLRRGRHAARAVARHRGAGAVPPPPPGRRANMRPPSAAAPAATSATGARFTFTPSSRSLRARAARERPHLGRGVPCSGCAGSGPANGRLRTSPPSWSTATRAPPCAARCSEPRERAPLGRSAAVLAEHDHAGGLARRAAGAPGRRAPTCRRSSTRAAGRPAGAGESAAARARRGACALAGRFAGGVAVRAGADGHARGQRQHRGGRERHQPAARGRIARQPHAAAQPAVTGLCGGAPASGPPRDAGLATAVDQRVEAEAVRRARAPRHPAVGLPRPARRPTR